MNVNFEKVKSLLKKIEPYYFYFFILLNLIPVVSFQFFPTVDGPAHLYNSKIILELIKSSDSILDSYYEFNKNINPNWFGHLILSGLLLIFPAFIAEKIILILYLTGLPIAIRCLFKTLKLDNYYILYLIFPFTYSFLFFFGFYNFNIGVILFFFALNYWIRFYNHYNAGRTSFLLILTTLMCLSHLFVYAFFLVTVFIYDILKDKNIFKQGYKNISSKCIAVSVGLIFLMKYSFFASSNETTYYYKPFWDTLSLIFDVSPAKGINYGKAAVFVKWITYVYSLLILFIISKNIYNFSRFITKFNLNNFWIIISSITIILIFSLPDANESDIGFLTSRLILFFFIFLTIGLATQNVPFWLKFIVFIVINYVNVALIKHNYLSSEKACIMAKEINQASKLINANSTVLPITYSDYFLYAHISNYAGIEKPIVVLENYETAMNHFPLVWKNESIQKLKFGNILSEKNCFNWIKTNNNKGNSVDYVLVIKDADFNLDPECNELIDNELQLNYREIFSGSQSDLKLYVKKM